MGSFKIRSYVHDAPTADAYKLVSAFEEYPRLCDAVVSVDVVESGDGFLVSAWEVHFRRGILRWTERAQFDPAAQRITFSAVEGDVDEFTGHWLIEEQDGGSIVEFLVDFDIGIPTLEHILDPIAEEALFDNMQSILRSLFDNAQLVSAEGSTAEWSS